MSIELIAPSLVQLVLRGVVCSRSLASCGHLSLSLLLPVAL
jgi:hypothetical protein